MERRGRLGRDLSGATVLALVSVIGCSEPGAPPEPAAGAVETVQQKITPGRPPYTLFESGPVRPLALSPDGSMLFAVNTPDGQLEIFDVHQSGLTLRDSVPVGLEPVAVAARTNDEVWVVNHLSDSVSVVAVSAGGQGRVVRTLLVGDEPRDIVFAGTEGDRGFITTAHRGQNSPVDPALFTPGVGRADVWVFDTGQLGSSLGGDPLTIITLFSDTPRALAVTPDGTRVYAAGFLSGNRTTIVTPGAVPDGGELVGGLPRPNTNHQLLPQPETGLIVKFNGSHWVDELNRSWDQAIRLSLPDKDVFVIDATSNPPAQLAGSAGFYAGVGTVLFNMIVNPVNGKVYVSNTEARNEERFEGPGVFAGHTVRGHVHESRITVLSGSTVAPRHLNKHVIYNSCCVANPSESDRSLAMPLEMAITSNGAQLFVAAFSSSKIGVFNTMALETDTFVPDTANHIEVTGGGPAGLVLDEARGRLYALTRFNNAVAVIDTAQRAQIGSVSLHNPEPTSVTAGRRFLYDARRTSSHGDSSCGSCHVFGDFDALAWDLGNPDGAAEPNPNPIISTVGPDTTFPPMKGPMTTQSLRGMANHGPMHWRGDRTGGSGTPPLQAPNVQPDTGSYDEAAAFKKFNPAFEGLLGNEGLLTAQEMQAFTDFILQNTYPPNPIRNLDNSLTADQAAGREVYNTSLSPSRTCQTCHVVDPNGNREFGVTRPGFFGSSGLSVQGETQNQTMKVPHLRNIYQKVGMWGMGPEPANHPLGTPVMGDQIRGFGMAHHGAVDNVDSVLAFPGFSFNKTPVQRRQIAQFIMAMDAEMTPIVGQQITLSASGGSGVGARIDLLEARAAVGDCDLIAKVSKTDRRHGYEYLNNGSYQPDVAAQPPLASAALRALAGQQGQEVTFTCTPPGSGRRMAVDRDLDGFLDGDEIAAGTNQSDPASHP